MLGDTAPDMANTIRRLQFDDVLTKSQNLGASVADPSLSLPKILQQLREKKHHIKKSTKLREQKQKSKKIC